MDAALHHALLGVSVSALWAAAVRLASPLAPDGAGRAIATCVLAAAAAVAEALALGLVGLGGNAAALAPAALCTWLAAWRLLPRPEQGMGSELAGWWAARAPAERAACGAAAGAAAAWAAWQLRWPALGFDTVHYHLPEIVLWVQGGSPGSIETVIDGLPVGNYPVTNEVLLAWATGISSSFVPVTLWPWPALALTAVAGWAGLRALAVPRPATGLAVLAVCLLPPLVSWQSNGAMTDPPALAWLVACASLCALARERPPLLAPALLAAGLAVGTKTTTAPMALLVLALAGWHARPELRRLRGPLLVATAAAAVVGGTWYLRNLIGHGSPFWPILALPWGDSVPASVDAVDTSFIDRPGATVERLGDDYLERFGAGLLLIAGGLAAPLLARRREVAWAALATLAGALIWARAPVTGLPEGGSLAETTFSTTRYLLPVVATGALALALAARGAGPGALVAQLVLAGAAVLGLVQSLDLGFPVAPSAFTPLAGALLGAACALAAGALGAGAPRAGRGARYALPALAVAAAALLALPAAEYVERHGRTDSLPAAKLARWLAADSRYEERDDPVLMTPTYAGPLAGAELEHELAAIDPDDPCARLGEAWLIVYRAPLEGALPADVASCAAGVRPAYSSGEFDVYGPPGAGATRK